jgi:hypothetical protein
LPQAEEPSAVGGEDLATSAEVLVEPTDAEVLVEPTEGVDLTGAESSPEVESENAIDNDTSKQEE